jgi:ferric-dicitrate binding protein FerR (iron transport regulator)
MSSNEAATRRTSPSPSDAASLEAASLEGLGSAARRELGGHVSDDAHTAGRERLVLAALKKRALPRRTSSRRMLVLLAACFALAIAAFFVVRGRGITQATTGAPPQEARALEVDVDDGTDRAALRPGGFVSGGAAGAKLRFSDGSRVVVGEASDARIADVGPLGARVVLGEGSVHLDVVHHEGTAWAVEAGPYVVRVTGTSFDVTWSRATGAFEVRMQEGTVTVEGPGSPRGVPVHAGQALVGDPSGVLRVGPTEEIDAKRADAAGAAPSASPSVTASATSSSAPRASSWSSRVASGDYRGVLEDAQARGIDGVLRTAPLDDLVALADAARYEKAPATARRALEAERERFPTSQAGRNATFLLGRIAEDSEGDPSRAIALYDAYLAEGGPFAAEALGRKMVALDRSRGRAFAEPVARLYLERHPDGAYAGAARAILDAP